MSNQIGTTAEWATRGMRAVDEAFRGHVNHFVTPPDHYFVYSGRTNDFSINGESRGMKIDYRPAVVEAEPTDLYLVTNSLALILPAHSNYFSFDTIEGPNRSHFVVGLGRGALRDVKVERLSTQELKQRRTKNAVLKRLVQQATTRIF